MLKKLYFRLSETRTHVFDITRTIRVDKPGYTKWVISVKSDNDLGVCEVVATTNDCTFDVIEDEVLVASKIQPAEWTVNIEPEYAKSWTVKGEISWTDEGGLEITDGHGTTTHLSERLCDFDVDKENRVITARQRN
ncbi:hypothetical protein [Siphovirus Jomon_CT89]|nr:hypothetical protein [Siphovirus Jomon_CT89]